MSYLLHTTLIFTSHYRLEYFGDLNDCIKLFNKTAMIVNHNKNIWVYPYILNTLCYWYMSWFFHRNVVLTTTTGLVIEYDTLAVSTSCRFIPTISPRRGLKKKLHVLNHDIKLYEFSSQYFIFSSVICFINKCVCITNLYMYRGNKIGIKIWI